MKKIAIIDNQFAHGTSLGSGDLKIYPKNFIWDRSRILENHYLFITEGSFDELDMLPVPADRKVAFIIEPQSINPGAYAFIQRNWSSFAHVLSHDKEFNRGIPNSLYYPFGGVLDKAGR